MKRKEVQPLSEGLLKSISESIDKIQYVTEKASRDADSAEGDVKAQDISGEEEVKADASTKKAPARKGDQAQADSMEKIKESYMDEKACVGEMKKLYASACSKTEMYNKVSEKYGCSKEKFEELYAQYCSMKEDADLEEMKGATAGLRKSKAFPLRMANDAKKFAKKVDGKVEKKGATLYVTYDLPEEVKESQNLDESKKLLDRYQELRAKGKKDHNIIDIMMSDSSFKRFSRDQMTKIIGDALRSGKISRKVKEEVEFEKEMDPVNKVAVKKKFDDRKDKDIDNDGDVDSSDKYLHKRRKAISKALTEKPKKSEASVDESADLEEAYKTPAEAQAIADGKKAARQGKKYADNPHKKGSKEFTAWSKGHNMARESVEVCHETLEENFAVHKNGKPLKIKGKEVTAGSKEAAQKAIDTMKKQPFNKDAKFTIVQTKSSGSRKPYLRKNYGGSTSSMPSWRYAERGESTMRDSFDLSEARGQDELYFDTYSAAVQYAKAKAEKMGYEVEEDDWFRQVTTGKGKPGRGKTTRHVLKLTKNGKPTRKGLAIQVYNRETDKKPYELNSYVS